MSASDAPQPEVPKLETNFKPTELPHHATTEAYEAMKQPVGKDGAGVAQFDGITVASVTASHNKVLTTMNVPAEARILLARTATQFAEEHEAAGNHGAASVWRDYVKSITT